MIASRSTTEEKPPPGGAAGEGVSSLVEEIQRILEEKGLVKREVAERAGFTKQQFCDMLHGRKVIRAEYIPRIARALEVSIGELFSEG